MSTRYFIWGSSLAVFFGFLRHHWGIPKLRRQLFTLVLVGSLAPLPFMVRNLIVNGDPIYPLIAAKLQHFNLAHFGGGYGRGGSIVALLLLPFDYLYTNTFVKPIFDYSLGKLFYAQLFAVLAGMLFYAKQRGSLPSLELRHNKVRQSVLIFFCLHTVIWFGGSQQTRFFVPGLVLVNVAMLLLLFRTLPSAVLVAIVAISAFSALSIQKDSVLMALGRKDTIFRKDINALADCLTRVGNPGLIGHTERFGSLGFFDHEFVFTKGHVFAVPAAAEYLPDFSYGYKERDDLIPWPKEKPCGWK